MKIVASYLSIPSRVSECEKTLNNLLVFCDIVHVYCNNYKDIPEFLLNNDKVIVANSEDYVNYGLGNKFFWVDKIKESYHIICNDNFDMEESGIKLLIDYIKSNDNNIVLMDKDVICYYSEYINFNLSKVDKKNPDKSFIDYCKKDKKKLINSNS